MSKNSNITYEHRQSLLQTGNLWHIAVGIAVSENIDWYKNNRGFKDKNHFQNWVKMIARKYSLDLTDFKDTLNELITDGYFKVKKVNGRNIKIWRTLPDIPAVVEEEEEQDDLGIVGLD